MNSTDKTVEIFTDGACSGNPGPGGWGAILRCDGTEKEMSGGALSTTNNRMEMMAAIMALEAIKTPTHVKLTSDSKYLIDGATQWMSGWIKRGWKTADKKPVKNIDLWQRLQQAMSQHKVEFFWVRGHNGHAENERVDQLAVAAIEKIKSGS